MMGYQPVMAGIHEEAAADGYNEPAPPMWDVHAY
jgi:hypothetical protein